MSEDSEILKDLDIDRLKMYVNQGAGKQEVIATNRAHGTNLRTTRELRSWIIGRILSTGTLSILEARQALIETDGPFKKQMLGILDEMSKCEGR